MESHVQTPYVFLLFVKAFSIFDSISGFVCWFRKIFFFAINLFIRISSHVLRRHCSYRKLWPLTPYAMRWESYIFVIQYRSLSTDPTKVRGCWQQSYLFYMLKVYTTPLLVHRYSQPRRFVTAMLSMAAATEPGPSGSRSPAINWRISWISCFAVRSSLYRP